MREKNFVSLITGTPCRSKILKCLLSDIGEGAVYLSQTTKEVIEVLLDENGGGPYF